MPSDVSQAPSRTSRSRRWIQCFGDESFSSHVDSPSPVYSLLLIICALGMGRLLLIPILLLLCIPLFWPFFVVLIVVIIVVIILMVIFKSSSCDSSLPVFCCSSDRHVMVASLQVWVPGISMI